MNEQTRKALELAMEAICELRYSNTTHAADTICDKATAAIDAALAPAAPVAQPLTDEQIDAAFRSAGFRIITPEEVQTARRSARAIERAHGIGQGADNA